MTTEATMNLKKLLRALFLAGHACWFAAADAVAADAVQLRTGAGQAMEATLYRPAAAGPFPAVLIMHTRVGWPMKAIFAWYPISSKHMVWVKPTASRHSRRMRRASMPILSPP